MEPKPAIFQNKTSKVELTLSDLNKEIATAINFLNHLKLSSSEMVKKLEATSTTTDFLEEYVHVNTCLLKCLSLMTEINCKLEWFQINDYNCKIDPKCTSEVNNKFDDLNFKRNSFGTHQIEEKFHSTKDFFEPRIRNRAPRFNVPNDPELFPISDKSTLILKGNQNTSCSYEKQELPSDAECLIKNDQLEKQCTKPCIENDVKSKGSILNNQVPAIPENSLNKLNSVLKPLPNSKFKPSYDKSNPDTQCNSSNLTAKVGEVSPKGFQPEIKSRPLSNNYICNTNEEMQSHAMVNKSFAGNPAESKTEIKPINISTELGSEYDVTVQYVKSPLEFYVHVLNKELNLLKELEKKLKLIMPYNKTLSSSKNETNKTLLRNEKDKYVLFYSKCDEIWMRAEVMDWCINYNYNLVGIFLLDYGESKCVSLDTLQPMPEFLKKYNAFAVRCHLQGVSLKNTKNENLDFITWEKIFGQKMSYFIDHARKIKIKVGPKDSNQPSTSLPVTLWVINNGVRNVNKLMLESTYPVEITHNKEFCQLPKIPIPKSNAEEEKTLKNWNPMKEDYESYENTYELNINDPAAVIYGYVGKDYDRVCRHFARTGKCFKGDACTKEHTPLDPSGFTTDKEEVYSRAYTEMKPPLVGETLNVEVICGLSVNEFSCIPCTSECYPDDEETLSTLVKYMNEPENVRAMRKLLIPPSVGQIVIALFTEDKSWYRAKILESEPEKDSYAVMFVDYGNQETVSLSAIRAIEERYLHLPFQAIHCSICGVKENPEVPKKKALEFLYKTLDGGLVSIEVIAKLPGDRINLLVNVFNRHGENVGKILIEKGYALVKEEMIVSNCNEALPG